MSNGKDNNSVLANRLVSSTKIKGEVFADTDFRIDGQLDGDLKTSGKVVIGKTGIISGRIECGNADIEGFIEGSILVSQLLSIKSTANIKGDIVTGKLSVEAGAIINITCSMEPSETES